MMETIIDYRQLIREYLSELETLARQQPRAGVETSCVFDEVHDQYLLVNTGWERGQRVDGMTLHVRIRDNKIWVEEDWTEEGIAEFLVREGVSRHDIVLGFQPPAMRCYTDFAVA
jgi:hypothetical protein